MAGAENRYNPALPLAALEVLDALSERVERLVDLPPPADAALVEGAASCLELAVLPGGASSSSGGAAAAAAEKAVEASVGRCRLNRLNPR